jgi:anhydro-N-acetylmuramic acid kinase
MTVVSILKGIKLLKKDINLIILTGGGRKNSFIVDELKKELVKINIKLNIIDQYGYNGDLLEAQMFGYLAVRSVKKMPLSLPSTTGVKKPVSGGKLNGKFI